MKHLVIAVMLVACGKSAPDNKNVCEVALRKQATCGDANDPEAIKAALDAVPSKVAACTKDDKAVVKYDACLREHQDCADYLTCMK